jgi:class 3 adenylate cyclase/tetratricopeptide (TPR) repeat protein
VKRGPAWGGERRKVVTVVFADIVGSTALGERVDPETLRWAMQRWFGSMDEAVSRHGGTVENYVGDAVMAVFGIPVAYEDDALRAVQAAADMREQVALLGAELQRERGVELAVRIGVNTGEAVTGDAPGGRTFTTGDIVNVGARLEQSARPGDILLGGETFRLVRHAVQVEPVAPLRVKGKQDPLSAFRLLSVAADAQGRPQRVGTPMVDRAAERERLVEAFERVITERSCQLVTVLGSAGVGKSRVVAEVLDSLHDRATVAGGRCLPYGEGLTWWPLVEALGNTGLLAQVSAEEPATARATAVLKPSGESVSTDEAFWVLRRTLEALARRHPLVLVVDDLHWGQSTFMDFLEHVATRTTGAPLLLLAMARPEIRQARAGWGAGPPHTEMIALEPLAATDAAELLRHLVGAAPLDAAAAARILDVADGYPLFVVEVVAMLADDGVLRPDGDGEPAPLEAVSVPPTIHALIAARLDRLTPGERAVIEAAAIEGKEFARASVDALVAGGASVEAELRALVDKELIRVEDRAAAIFRFAHQLIRDTAYDAMSKAVRAELHERFADWLDGGSVEAPDELIGYHLERAVVLHRELGETEAGTAGLAARAATSLGAAGRRAAQRDEHAAACALLERAASLVQADRPAHAELMPALGASLFEAGRMSDAIRVLDDAIAGGPDTSVAAQARIERELVRLEAEPSFGTEHARRVAEEALPLLERLGDHYGECRAWSLYAQAAWLQGYVARADDAWGRAAASARRAGGERELFGILGWRATAAVLGPMPVDDAILRCEGLRDLVDASPVTVALMVNPLASLHAMRGEFDVAERLVGEANATLHQLGSAGWVSHHEALVRLLAGQPALAERPLRAGLDRLSSVHDSAMLATTTAMLAQALYAQGRLREADELCRQSARAGGVDDIVTQVIWRGVKAKILARQDRGDEAEAIAREAVALVEPTDLLSHHADAMLDLAEVLRASTRMEESNRAVRTGLSLYEEKGNTVGAARARSLLDSRSGEK